MRFWLILLIVAVCGSGARAESAIRVVSAPAAQGQRAVQPRIVVDNAGTVHLIYFSGDPAAGNVFYSNMKAGAGEFSAPVRVNTEADSAVAMGTIRGADSAVGRFGRVHVVWNPSQKSSIKGMCYARMNDQGAFEPQRNVTAEHFGLDGGGSVAADSAGNVYVAWHAPISKNGDEADRRVWIAKSADDGKTFAAETMAWNEPTGACACCGLRSFIDGAGNLFVIYRSAREMVNRDMYLLCSTDGAKTFRGEMIAPMKVGMCIMSSESFSQGASTLCTWETQGQVYWGKIDGQTLKDKIPAPGSGKNRKHPVIAQNKNGEVLLAWTEGTTWGKGGSIAWQIFDVDGRPQNGRAGRVEDLSAWSFPAVLVAADGQFTLIR
jgi:hypothetical protein